MIVPDSLQGPQDGSREVDRALIAPGHCVYLMFVSTVSFFIDLVLNLLDERTTCKAYRSANL
jgi:hypothetical protein